MDFRKDINGLRAIAVIAVVLFHFNSSWIPGGFAGVDVFFVISGFLMTRIIFRGFEEENFSIMKFYVARANRIIPPLAALCFVLLMIGWFYLTPLDYKELGKHAGSSMGFISNIIYWKESGYFDAASKEKWLLHTWSLSAEWQFYIIYPLILVTIRNFISLKSMKTAILIATAIGFIYCIITTHKWPNAAYYLLPTRAWEMMIGGIAYLYPLKIVEKNKKIFEITGITLILLSYLLITKENSWPGYYSLAPVLGTFFVIQAKTNDSIVTGNILMNYIGRWSYSIYLWHWPIVVGMYYFSISQKFVFIGIALSVFAGFLSYTFIERIKYKYEIFNFKQLLKSKPVVFVFTIGLLSSLVFINDGFIRFSPYEYQKLISQSIPSKFRDKCHIHSYTNPSNSCEYFGKNISWATFGDSHTVEIAYALARKLEAKGEGLKHFSFSGCRPSYKESKNLDECSKWYNETIEYTIKNDHLKNIVFNHRFTTSIIGGNADLYPEEANIEILKEHRSILEKLDQLILLFASKKDNVYIFYPIPELPRPINNLIGIKLRNGESLENIVSTNLDWYRNRNKFITEHFDKASYPDNVHLIKIEKVFCDNENCYAVRNGIPLYFDDDHPSILGATKLVDLIEIQNQFF